MEDDDRRQGYLRSSRVDSTDDEPIILQSAHRHGVTEDTMLHALRYAVTHFVQEDDLTMFIRPDRDGTPVEVGVVAWHDGIAVVHAMRPARAKYLR